MNKNDSVTIQQVAFAAGVSKQTVSRVINNRPDVADGTRKHVLNVIETLGYHPSAVARSLTSKRTRMLAVVTAGLHLIGPSNVLDGITLTAEALGYTLLIKNLATFRVDDYQGLIRFINEMRVEGVAWAIPDFEHYRTETIGKISSLPVPVVFQGSAPLENTLTVTVDNYAGGCQATQHLIDQGYRKIAHVAGPQEFWDAEARKTGWKDTLVKNGLPAEDRQWAAGDWSVQSGAQAAGALLAAYPEMDAIFAGNDQMAIGVIQCLREHGLRVPQDVALIGYDNIPESAFIAPPLSTIAQDFHLMGAKTIELLVEAIHARQAGLQPPAVQPVSLQTTLIVRASSAAKAG